MENALEQWVNAGTASPGDRLLPTDYGWSVIDNLLKPTWFEGPAIPDSLFKNGSNNIDDMAVEGDSESEMEVCDSDGEAWSEDSDGEEEDGYHL